MAPDLHKIEPQCLRPILDWAFNDELWSSEDLGSILRHQLRTPLRVDLDDLGHDVLERCCREAQDRGVRLFTFGELLGDPHPPVELLVQVHRFAKASRLSGASGMPREIATVLYFAAIVAARLRCGQRISGLSADALAQGVDWARRQSWLDAQTAELFEQAATLDKDAP